MKVFNTLKRPIAVAVAAMTCLTTLLPTSVMAAEPELEIPSYLVAIDAGENGDIRLTDEFGVVMASDGVPVEYRSAVEGETVYFTVAADENFIVDDIKVADSVGAEISYQEKETADLYAFQMPASNVKISSSFSAVEISNIDEAFSETAAMSILEATEETESEAIVEDGAEVEKDEADAADVAENTDAEDGEDEDTGDSQKEDAVVDETSEAESEAEKESESVNVEETTTTAPVEEETTTAEEIKEIVEDKVAPEYSEAMLAIISSYNFSSGRLIVGTSNAGVLADFAESIISSYNGLYILQFDTQESAIAAFAQLYSKVELLTVDSEMYVAEPADDVVETPVNDVMTSEENPFEELKEAISESPSISYDIALIDTGANSSNVINAVSMLGDNAADDNGHGTRMAGFIAEQNPDARILSIKAFDANGKADISAVYAAFEYAISQNVKVINLSASAIATQDNAIVAEIIRSAIANGIVVVGSAGNNGNNVAYYIPGNISEAFIIGACNADGEKLGSSNYGSTVDYNVVADSTSEAAAKFSGFISKNGFDNIPDDVVVFSTEGKTVSEFSFPAVYYAVNADGSFDVNQSITLYTVSGVGDNDVLYFTEDLGDPFGMGSNYVPMYCIQHSLNAPHGASYSDFSYSSNVLGYIMRHGYPNATWGLDWTEAQYLTQSAVFMSLGVDAYGTSYYGDHSIYNPGEIYNFIWANGNFQIAIDLLNAASANATSADAAFVRYWDSTYDNIQNMISPLPDVQYGYLDLTKASNPSNAKNTYTMEGAVYGVYTNSNASTLFSSDGYYWGFKVKNNNTAVVARCQTSKSPSNRDNWVVYSPETRSMTFEAGTKLWVKEILAPSNGNYEIDTTTHNVTIVANTTVHVSSTDKLGSVYLQIKKVSGIPNMTNNNDCYSLSGATYTVKNSAGTTVGTLTTGADGMSNKLQLQATGTYYIQESVPSKGFLINTENIRVNVSTLNNETITRTSEETPGNDPIGLRIQKVDKDTGEAIPTGAGTFANAEFTLKYWENTSGNTNGRPAQTWVFKVSENGRLQLAGDMIHGIAQGTVVSGNLYYDENDVIVWPVGTYTIEESQSPSGYLIADTWKDQNGRNVNMPLAFMVRVNTNNTKGEAVYTDGSGNIRTLTDSVVLNINEQIIRGGFKFKKFDSETGLDTPQGDATLKQGTYQIVNLNNADVVVNGTKYGSNAVCYEFTTKEGDTEFVSDSHLLPVGRYRIQEKNAPNGYHLDGTIQAEFEIAEANGDGYIVDLTVDVISNPPWRGGFTFQKADSETKLLVPQGDARLGGGSYQIINMSTNPVVVQGVRYQPGAVVYSFVTTEGEKFESAVDLLPYGSYQLKETAVPTGYKLEGVLQKNFKITYAGEIVDLVSSIENPPIRGGFKIAKNDADFGHEFQGNSESLSATYELVNKSEKAVLVNGTSYDVNAVIMTFETDDEGYYTSAADLLPYGTYQINETIPPEHYTDKGLLTWTFSVREDKKIYENTEELENEIYRGGFTFNKLDIETEEDTPQGDATLIGGTYDVYNRSLHKVRVLGEDYEVDEVCFTFTTSGQNEYTSPTDLLPFGSYEIVEVDPPVGYLNEGIINAEFDIVEDGQIVNVKEVIRNEVIRGGVEVQKFIDELATNQNEGLSSLAGCEVAIVNASENHVLVDGKLYDAIPDMAENKSETENSITRTDVGYTRDQLVDAVEAAGYDNVVVRTLVTDKMGFATTEADTLPYGTYYLYEVSANESVQIDEDWVVRLEIREDGVISNTDGIEIEDPIVRGDIRFNKVNIDGIFRPNVPFLFVALDENGNALEAHVMVTDAEGLIDTASRDNTNNTNGFDKYVVYDTESKEYYVTDEGEALLASGEAQTWGIWFSQGRDPETGARTTTKAVPTEDRAALYYGDYQIFEIKCKDNSDKEEDLLYSPIIPVYEKMTVLDEAGQVRSESSDKVINYHPFVDLEVVLTSTALDDITNTHVTFVHDNLVLSDRITYTHLKATTTYKWVVKFVQTSDPANVLSTITIDGYVPATSSSNVQTAEGAFTIHTDGSMTNADCASTPTITTTGNVDTTGLDGEKISAIVYLYEYTQGYDYETEQLVDVCDFIKSHNTDVSDVKEMIYVPSLETTASDVFTKDHVGTKNEKDAIIDSVDMTNLGPKEKYKLIETIMDKETGEVFAEVEQAIHEFYSNRPDLDYVDTWHVEMPEIAVDSSAFDAKTLVAYEQLWRIDDAGNFIDEFPVVTHESIIDEDQSIHYIDINTNATDEFTGDHVGTVTEKTTITDEVELFNLIPGMVYTIKGELVYKEDCTDSNGVAHKAGEVLPVLDGSEVEKTITADADYMTVEISYVIDSSMLEGITVVSTEYAYHNDVLIDKHVDLEDEDQSVHFPKVRTMAVDNDTLDDVGNAHEKVSITDTVSLENLIPGMTYSIIGRLINQEDGSEYVQSDLAISSCEFVAEEANEFHEIVFSNIDGEFLTDRTLVVFEVLMHNNVNVARHEDIHDKAQSIHYPYIHTNAVDSNTKDHVGSIFGKAINDIREALGEEIEESAMQQIVDTVTLGNLVPGRTYTVSGVLMNKETGEPILVNDEEIRQTATIVVGEGTITSANGEATTVTEWNEELNRVSGTVDLTFALDSAELIKYGTEDEEFASIVVFEKLFHKNAETGVDVEVTSHEDINDENQTVTDVEIKTTAIDTRTGDHVGDSPRAASTDANVEDELSTTISDVVRMKGLVPDMEYTLRGLLVVKEDSAEGEFAYLKADGTITSNPEEAISAESTFVAENAAEEHELTFDVTSELVAGKSIVVFEKLYHNDVMISVHADLEDENQTVHFPNVTTDLADIQTGDDVGTVGKTVLVDKVTYENLIPDEDYTVSGKIAYQKDCIDSRGLPHKAGEWVIDPATGEDYVVTAELKAGEHEANGFVEISFEIDSYLLRGLSVVAEETLIHNDVAVAVHADLDDDSQTVHFPDIFTNATDIRTGDHVASVFGKLINALRSWLGETDVNGNGIADDVESSLVDTVTLINLVPGRTYTVSGVLMNQLTGEPVIIDGEKVTQTATVVAGENSIKAEGGEATTVTEWDAEHNSVSGTVELVFTYDASKLMNFGTDDQEAFTVVVFEGLYHNDIKVAAHEDIHDEAQTLYGASIDSVALDEATNSHVGDSPRHATTDERIADESSANIVETVKYSGLQVGSEYTINGVLAVKEDSTSEKPMYLTADGSVSESREDAITVNETFVAETAEGEVELVFTVGSELVAGKTIVVFDDLIHNDVIIITHSNINDEDQTIHYPAIGTKLYVGGTEYNDSYYNKVVTLIDTVTYTNLIPGLAYELDGSIIFKESGEPVTVDGMPVTDHITFVPSAPDGSVDLAFSFPAAGFEGKEIVAYEVLLFAEHKDGGNIDKLFYECECGQLFETIDAWQAHLHSYDLMCHCGERFLGADELDEHLVAFGTDAANHYIEGSDHDTYAQVKEPVTGNMITVATHADINDRAQTVCLPGLKTTLIDQNGTKMPLADKEMTLIDTVAYEALTPGNTYTMKGKLVDKATGLAARDDAGNIITAETTFTAESGTGTIDIVFHFSGLSLAGKSLVAFESLYYEAELVGLHEDINDEDQTVYVPSVATTAKFDNQIQMADSAKDNTIIDVVEYSNLIVGEKYLVSGRIMDKATNKPILVNGKEITAETTFTATAADGTVELKFTVPANAITGEAVVFEKLFVIDAESKILVGTHEDITDESQTVIFPEIKTTAQFKAGSNGASSSANVVSDTVQYKNLKPGTYVFKATLMNKATGQPVMVNGQAVTAEMTANITEPSGNVVIDIQVPANAIVGEAVVFEEVYAVVDGKQIIVGEHKDINDKAQTVVFTPPVTPPPTGDTHNIWLWLILGVAAMGICTGTILCLRRKKRNEE